MSLSVAQTLPDRGTVNVGIGHVGARDRFGSRADGPALCRDSANLIAPPPLEA